MKASTSRWDLDEIKVSASAADVSPQTVSTITKR